MSTSISEKDLTDIIVEGNAVVLVNKAQAFGAKLAQGRLTKTQIRNVFGEVRKIEAQWSAPKGESDETQSAQENIRRLLLLKPRMSYQAARQSQTRELMEVLADAIDKVVEIDELPEQRKRFGYFVDFFEAILAYHTAEGGR